MKGNDVTNIIYTYVNDPKNRSGFYGKAEISRSDLAKCILQTNSKTLDILIMHFKYGMTYSEIDNKIGYSQGTSCQKVRKWLTKIDKIACRIDRCKKSELDTANINIDNELFFKIYNYIYRDTRNTGLNNIEAFYRGRSSDEQIRYMVRGISGFGETKVKILLNAMDEYRKDKRNRWSIETEPLL